MSNGGYIVKPNLRLNKILNIKKERVISNETSREINLMLREVVASKHGTASLADVFGFNVGGKTGTAKKNFYGKYSNNINIVLPEGETEKTVSHNTRGKDKITVEQVFNKIMEGLN